MHIKDSITYWHSFQLERTHDANHSNMNGTLYKFYRYFKVNASRYWKMIVLFQDHQNLTATFEWGPTLIFHLNIFRSLDPSKRTSFSSMRPNSSGSSQISPTDEKLLKIIFNYPIRSFHWLFQHLQCDDYLGLLWHGLLRAKWDAT